jgi:hypothetical protein
LEALVSPVLVGRPGLERLPFNTKWFKSVIDFLIDLPDDNDADMVRDSLFTLLSSPPICFRVLAGSFDLDFTI